MPPRSNPIAPRWRALAPFLPFAFLLLFISTFIFLGDTGKYSDDYTVTMRNLATGDIEWGLNPWTRWPYFWRPLHLALIYAVGTAFWSHEWVGHLLSALAHASAVLMLFVFLRRLQISLRAALGAALIYLTFVHHAEAVHWFSAICTPLGTLLLLTTLMVALHDATETPSHPALCFSPRRLALLAALAFATACFYEPSAAALGALPFVYLIAHPTSATRSHALKRSLVPTIVVGSVCALYAVLLISTAPPWQRGSPASFASGAPLPERCTALARAIIGMLWGQRARQVWSGSITEGLALLRQWPYALWLVGLALSVLPFTLAWMRGSLAARTTPRAALGPPADDFCADSKPRHSTILLLGLAIFTLAWLPILVVKNNSMELRLWHTPLTGLAIIVAVGFDTVLARSWSRPSAAFARFAVLLLILSTAALGAIGMAGFQRSFRRLWQSDNRLAAQLRAAIPTPPTAAVIMPLRSFDRASETGFPGFDLAIEGGFAAPWSSWGIAQRTYARRDLTATHFSARIQDLPLSGFSEQGVWSTVHLVGPYEHGPRGCFVPWTLAIPISLAGNGQLHFFNRIIIERPGTARDLIVLPPLTRALDPAIVPDSRLRTFTLPDPELPALTEISTWSVTTDVVAQASRVCTRRWLLGINRPSIDIDVNADAPAALTCAIPPLAAPQRLVIRWATANARDPGASAATLRLDARIDALPSTTGECPLADALNDQRWRPLGVDLPASPSPRILTLTITAPATGTEPLRVYISAPALFAAE